MRFLLFIPVFVLFLSNVPFIQKMPMEKMMAAMADEEGCCKKDDRQMGSCHAEPAQEAATPCGEQAKESCQRTETTCVCICCFQFMAPQQELQPFQLTPEIISAQYTGYIQIAHQEPPLSPPWQPPDLV